MLLNTPRTMLEVKFTSMVQVKHECSLHAGLVFWRFENNRTVESTSSLIFTRDLRFIFYTDKENSLPKAGK